MRLKDRMAEKRKDAGKRGAQDKDRRVLVIADIEGSSGCFGREASAFMTPQWVRACAEMTLDVDAVCRALFEAGAEEVTVKDFHRTGYNLFSDKLDQRIRLISGYKRGGVPGIGPAPDAGVAMFLGMHAASGTDGFIAHTLTSRVAALRVNGKILSELELFASSLAPFGIRPVFFSGCPVACGQAADAIPGIDCYPVDKAPGKKFDAVSWRRQLALRAAAAMDNRSTRPFRPAGPFKAVVTFRDGPKTAEKIARRWGFFSKGPDVVIHAPSIDELYMALIRACYLTPAVERLIPFGLLSLYNLIGWAGLKVARKRDAGY